MQIVSEGQKRILKLNQAELSADVPMPIMRRKNEPVSDYKATLKGMMRQSPLWKIIWQAIETASSSNMLRTRIQRWVESLKRDIAHLESFLKVIEKKEGTGLEPSETMQFEQSPAELPIAQPEVTAPTTPVAPVAPATP